MTDIPRKLRLIAPALVGLVLLWGTAAACSSGASENAPVAGPRGPASEPAVVLTRPPPPVSTSTPTIEPTATPLHPTPTVAPTPQAPIAAPTATPTAVPETAPTGEPTRSANSAAIFADLPLLEDRAFHHLNELVEEVGVRTSGTDLEEAAAEYLVQRLKELGYGPEIQEFTRESPAATLEISGLEPGSLNANILTGTGSGSVTAQLVSVGQAKAEDIPEEGLDGRIALIERGEITFGSKVSRVHNAGAVAAIIYNNEQGNFRGTLGGRGRIPAISLSRADGLMLKELVEQDNPVEATVAVQGNAVPSRNVIAELPGSGDGVIVMGAHYDTVPDSVGASDNSSGVAALLAVAERLGDRTFPYTLRFVAFGSEETGLHGSEHYVDTLSPEELENIRLMINLDSIGSGDRLVVSGDRWAVSHVREAAEREGIALDVSARGGGGSDHANFRQAWVPVVFFLSDDLSRINSPADTMEHINPRLLGDATALTLDLLENVDGLPGYGQ